MPFQWNTLVPECVQPVLDPKTNAQIGQVATLSCIPAVMGNLISALFIFVGLVCLVLLIVSGYKFINSAGDPKKLGSARDTLIHAILGLLIVIFSFFIINLISIITSVPCIKSFGLSC